MQLCVLESICSLEFAGFGGEPEDLFIDVLAFVAGMSFFFRDDFAGEAVIFVMYTNVYQVYNSCLPYAHTTCNWHMLFEELENRFSP